MTIQPTALIVAIPEEMAAFGDPLTIASREAIAGIDFFSGTLDGWPVVVAESGLGKVNAALVTALLLHRFHCRALIFSGVAGGVDPGHGIGDVIIGQRVVCHDYGRLEGERLIVHQPGDLPFPGIGGKPGFNAPEELMARVQAALDGFERPVLPAAVTGGAARRIELTLGTIASGDSFVSCATTRERLHRQFDAQAVEMEGAAVAQIAERFGVPCLIVRVLSDLAGEEGPMDFNRFLPVAADIAATVARRLLPVL